MKFELIWNKNSGLYVFTCEQQFPSFPLLCDYISTSFICLCLSWIKFFVKFFQISYLYLFSTCIAQLHNSFTYTYIVLQCSTFSFWNLFWMYIYIHVFFRIHVCRIIFIFNMIWFLHKAILKGYKCNLLRMFWSQYNFNSFILYACELAICKV